MTVYFIMLRIFGRKEKLANLAAEDATRERLERLAESKADAEVQLAAPINVGAGSGEWPFKVGGTGFDAVLCVAVQPDQ